MDLRQLKDIVAAALNESGLRQRQNIADADVKMRAGLEDAGMKFDAANPRGFRSVLRKSGYDAAWAGMRG
jgi:TRAP-type C4-dicarboxylate transport system substrate-binding protein